MTLDDSETIRRAWEPTGGAGRWHTATRARRTHSRGRRKGLMDGETSSLLCSGSPCCYRFELHVVQG